MTEPTNEGCESKARVFYQAHLCYDLNRATEQSFVDFVAELLTEDRAKAEKRVREKVEAFRITDPDIKDHPLNELRNEVIDEVLATLSTEAKTESEEITN